MPFSILTTEFICCYNLIVRDKQLSYQGRREDIAHVSNYLWDDRKDSWFCRRFFRRTGYRQGYLWCYPWSYQIRHANTNIKYWLLFWKLTPFWQNGQLHRCLFCFLCWQALIFFGINIFIHEQSNEKLSLNSDVFSDLAIAFADKIC